MSEQKSKNSLRKTCLEKRKTLSPKKHNLLSREIVKNFYSNISIKKNAIIATYMPFGREVDVKLLTEIYEEDGHKICLPTIENKKEPMCFREFKTGIPLTKNEEYQFLEPQKNLPELFPDVIITPLVGFDAAGNRLGQGAGFYDKTLNYLSDFHEFITVGVAFACQQVAYIKPEPHDYKLDAIVTEERVLVFD